MKQLSQYEKINDGNLYLVSTNEVAQRIQDNHIIMVAVTANIQGESNFDTRSETITSGINLSAFDPQYIKYLTKEEIFIDPMVINLSGENKLSLSNLETDEREVKFEMIPGKGNINTAWIANDAQDSAFIVVDTNSDGSINSTTEILSEYYESNNERRSFTSGSNALMGFDSNFDQKINKYDENWQELQIWLDDGDARTQPSELHKLSKYIDEIDISNIRTITENPSWANGNNIMREISGYKEGKELKIFDVGFQVAFDKHTLLNLDVKKSIKMIEEGEVGEIELFSKDSDIWVEEGRDKLTLVRLSGLPNEVVPSVGIKDSRGDWLFTWADLYKNSGKIELIPDRDYSGLINAQVMISQVQDSGIMLSSAMKTVSIDVEAVADLPILRVSNQEIDEDSLIYISEIIEQARLRDQDGSEELSFKLIEIPEEWELIEILNNDSNEFKIIEKDREFNEKSIKKAGYEARAK